MKGPEVPWWWDLIGALSLAISLLIIVGGSYVAWHFITKYW